MKLTSQNIQFIDNYLKNSEVIYYDIRMEMLDHVATAVEQKMKAENLDFHDAFKNYMVANKKEILKGNKLWPGISKDILLNFLKFLFQPIMILIGVSIYVFFKNVEVSSYFSESFTFKDFLFVILISLALFKIVYFRVVLKQRFYMIEKIFGLLNIIYYSQMFFLNQRNDETLSVFTISIFSYLLIAYLIYFTKQVYKFNTYKKQFVL
jgi:hypothetical protein